MSVTATSHEAHASSPTTNTTAVRWVQADALMSGASGLVLAAAAPILDGALGVSVGFLIAVGIFLLLYAGLLVLVARRGAPAPAVKTVVAGNALWVVASVAVVLTDVLSLSTAGTVFTLLQAGAVAIVADLQYMSIRWKR
jgi:hypothetical protein